MPCLQSVGSHHHRVCPHSCQDIAHDYSRIKNYCTCALKCCSVHPVEPQQRRVANRYTRVSSENSEQRRYNSCGVLLCYADCRLVVPPSTYKNRTKKNIKQLILYYNTRTIMQYTHTTRAEIMSIYIMVHSTKAKKIGTVYIFRNGNSWVRSSVFLYCLFNLIVFTSRSSYFVFTPPITTKKTISFSKTIIPSILTTMQTYYATRLMGDPWYFNF